MRWESRAECVRTVVECEGKRQALDAENGRVGEKNRVSSRSTLLIQCEDDAADWLVWGCKNVD